MIWLIPLRMQPAGRSTDEDELICSYLANAQTSKRAQRKQSFTKWIGVSRSLREVLRQLKKKIQA